MADDAYLIIEKAIESGNYEQAEQFAKARIKNFPEDSYGPFWLGLSLLNQKRYAEACIALKRSMALDDKQFCSICYYAYTKIKLCDWEELEDLKKIIFAATEGDFESGKFKFVDPQILLPLSPSISFQKAVAASRAKHFFNQTS